MRESFRQRVRDAHKAARARGDNSFSINVEQSDRDEAKAGGDRLVEDAYLENEAYKGINGARHTFTWLDPDVLFIDLNDPSSGQAVQTAGVM